MSNQIVTDHSRRNDAQLAHYRRHSPDAWQRLLDTMTHEERVEAERRADAAELDAFVTEWDTRSGALARVARALQGDGALIVNVCPRCQQPVSKDGTCGCNLPTAHVTAQMVADIWQDEGGPARIAGILRILPERERNRIAVDYWQLLRHRGHNASLVEVGIQLCVVERLAA